jgi:septum formation topological specificity factor MinE
MATKDKGRASKVEGQAAANGSHVAGGALIDQLGQRERSEAAEARERYRQLVIDCADGAEVDPDYAAETLAAVGLHAAELNVDVEAALRRRKLQEHAAGVEELRAEVCQINQQIEAAKAEFAEASQAYHAQQVSLNNRATELGRLIGQKERARALLIENCGDETLIDRLAEVRGELADVVHRYGDLHQVMMQVNSLEAKFRAMLRNPNSTEELAEAEENLRRLDADGKRAKLAALKEQREALQAQERDIRRQMVEA